MEPIWKLPVWFVLIAGATALYLAVAWWAGRRLEKPFDWKWTLGGKLAWYAMVQHFLRDAYEEGDTLFALIVLILVLGVLVTDVRKAVRFLKARRASNPSTGTAPN